MMPDSARLLDHMGRTGFRPAKLKELARELDVPSDDYKQFRELMRDLEESGRVTRVHKGRFVLAGSLSRTWGRLRVHERGYAFVARAGAEADVFVPAGSFDGAADGDWVQVEITEQGDGRERLPRGRVLDIRREQPRQQLGRYRRRGHLIVTDSTLVQLDRAAGNDLRDGDLAIVEVQGSGARAPGQLVRIVGDANDPRHDFDVVTMAHDIPLTDDPDAEAEAAALLADAETEREQQLATRRDLRDLTIVTIDPDEARDFDDAVSLEELPTGDQRLGVHIADVAHYVVPGSAIDRQARERATSVYLVDRVVHMLPRRIAADLCTLAPHQDRLAVSVFLDIDPSGVILQRDVCLSVVRSAERLTYSQVQAALDGANGAGVAAAYGELLERMQELSQRLRRGRLERGALDFDLPEPTVDVDEDGQTVQLGRAAHLASHRLIEEFMLAANEAVADICAESSLDVLFRIHDAPDPVKLEAFRSLAGSLGTRIPGRSSLSTRHLQQALQSLRDRPDAALLSQLLLRAMMRARYAVDEGEGHFCLASERYLHFTSPIRRYPDLVVHRALRAHLTGHGAETDEDLGWLAEWTSHCERRAEAAEREYIRVKQLRFMESKVGDEFDGVVSGVVGAGLFVEIGQWLVEGFCPVRLLEDDYFEFDESRHRMHGQRTGVVFSLGTEVKIRILTVQPALRRMDVLILEGGTSGPSGRTRKGGRSDRRASASERRQASRKARTGSGSGNRGRHSRGKKKSRRSR